MREEKKDEKGYFFVAQSSFTTVEKGMPLQVSLKRCHMGRRGGGGRK